MKTYEESLKTYGNNYSVLETAGKDERRETAHEMKRANYPLWLCKVSLLM
jgi:hypothetical protein